MRLLLLNGASLGVTFGTWRGGKQVAPTVVPFSVSVLAVVTNRVETTMLAFVGIHRHVYICMYMCITYIYIYIHI